MGKIHNLIIWFWLKKKFRSLRKNCQGCRYAKLLKLNQVKVLILVLLIPLSVLLIKFSVQKMDSKQKNLYLLKKKIKKHLTKKLIQTEIKAKSIKNNLLFPIQVSQ